VGAVTSAVSPGESGAAEELQRLLRRGDDHVVRLARHAEAAHVADDPLAQGQMAFARRVLQPAPRVGGIAEDIAVGGLGLGDGKQRRVRNAAGKRGDPRLVHHLEQLADLGCTHALRAARVARLPARRLDTAAHGRALPGFPWVQLCQYS
jgi:hypothetical protein